MSTSIVLVLLSIVYLASCIVYTPSTNTLLYDNPQSAFEEYNRFWNKTHSSSAEKLARFRNFLINAEKIEIANKQSTSATFGFTKFSDLSAEEFKASYLGAVPPPGSRSAPALVKERSVEQNAAIDWVAAGMTTPVKNQEQCGSCWAFSTTETVESANLIAGNAQTIGSPQEIVDCFTGASGCSGGWPVDALNWVVQQGGLDTDSCYPYTAQNGNCASSQCTPSPNLKIATVTSIASDEQSIYNALKSAPLSICCDASAWQNYNGGVLTADQCGTSVDHAIQLTGYSPNQGQYWIVRNSWGADWGVNGFIWLQYGQNTCDITGYVVSASC
eukprot:TRINITY_DN6_c0_g1_i33.p1 TRINITY_DN6_c0_g1~~TRINITY_DN6_c0_g1_i33.p1  ORF type:complete len:354 (-),score=74.03 TRINITY_DN6_c0_g1_i33:60-1049(-)